MKNMEQQHPSAQQSESPASKLEQLQMSHVEKSDAKVEPTKTEAEKSVEIEKARQAVMEQFAPPKPEAPAETLTEPAQNTPSPETIAKHDKVVRQETTRNRVADVGKGVGLTAGAAALLGAGAIIGGVATGAGLVAGTAAFAVALKKLTYNAYGFKAPHTHSWVMGPKHTVEQGITESLGILRKIPKKLLPVAVLGETYNLVQNLPSTRHGKKMEYQMHTHDSIIKNFQRLEQAGLADITSNEPMTRFGKPHESRLMIEKLTIGGAKFTDIFKPASYQDGGVFNKTPIRTVKFNVSPREMTLEDIKKTPQIKSLAMLPEGLLDVKKPKTL